MEYCKFLLASSGPKTDPYGLLLRYDYYACRAKEFTLYYDLVKDFCKTVHRSGSLCLLPNILMTLAYAKRQIVNEDI